MKRKYTYHKENCNCFIRETIIDILGRTITLGGYHAFEWTITIYTKDRIISTQYPNSKEAKKEFQKYKRQRY